MVGLTTPTALNSLSINDEGSQALNGHNGGNVHTYTIKLNATNSSNLFGLSSTIQPVSLYTLIIIKV